MPLVGSQPVAEHRRPVEAARGRRRDARRDTIDNNPEIIGQLLGGVGQAAAELDAGTGEVVDVVTDEGPAIGVGGGPEEAAIVEAAMGSGNDRRGRESGEG